MEVPSLRGKRVTILHCESEAGLSDGSLHLPAKNICLDYRKDIASHLFENWYENILPSRLPPYSLIVMDDASSHLPLADRKKNTKYVK